MATADKRDFIFIIAPNGDNVDGGQRKFYNSDDKIRQGDVPDRWLQHTIKDKDKPASPWNQARVMEPDPDDSGRLRPKLLEGYSWLSGNRSAWNFWIENRKAPELEDIAGRPLIKGARVAVAFALGRGAEQRIGRIAGFDKVMDLTGGGNVGGWGGDIDRREQIVVEWEVSNRHYGDSPERSKIFAILRRAVVIE